MSTDLHGRLRCDHCNKYASFEDSDSYTVYGAVYSSIDDGPEPHDPVELCGKCSDKLYGDLKKRYREGYRGGDWMKSGAERKAAKECGLVWVSNSTKIHDITGAEAFNCYIEESEYEHYQPKFQKNYHPKEHIKRVR